MCYFTEENLLENLFYKNAVKNIPLKNGRHHKDTETK